MTTFSRRQMLSGVAGIAGVAALSASGHVAAADVGEYGFAPGLIYLNTGSLGPTPRSILDEVLKAWTDLELNPVANASAARPMPLPTRRVPSSVS